jgi:hypothetical protein
MRALVPIVAVAVVACGAPASAPATATAPAPAAAPASATAPAAAPAVASPEGAEAPRPRGRPYEIHSTCAEVVTLVFGPDPKAASAGRRTIAESSTIEGPRDEGGNMTIWLLDKKGEPTVKVNVTRGMKRVEVGRSCSTLDAH